MADKLSEPSKQLSWRRRARPLLGTLVQVSILCEDDAEFLSLSGLAFDRVAHYHAVMSFHEATSDVRRIAAAAAGETFSVAAETRTVIAAAQAFEMESEGIFDVTVAAALIARGLLPDVAGIGRLAAPGRPSSASACLRLEADGCITVLTPVAIDLGGIAKGAAVDAALAAIRSSASAGVVAAAVNAGGDMALFGAQDLPVTVVGPSSIRVCAGTLANGAIATSGPFDAGIRSSLVLRPGREARWAERSVSVVAPTCLVADALTKVLAVLGTDAAPLLRRHGATGFSVDGGGQLEHVQ